MSKFPIHIDLPKSRLFIETGTANGYSSASALVKYEKVFTIDTVELKNQKFLSNPNYCFYHGDSRKVLPQILSTINERCTFWLDAHPNNFDVDTWPLFEEIDIIAKHFVKNHNILIDDIDIVCNKHKLNHVIKLITKINEGYKLNMQILSQARSLDTFIAITEK